MKIFIVGSTGRMGKELVRRLHKEKGAIYVGGLSRTENRKQKNYSSFLDIKDRPDVVIDFSSPEIFRQALQWCVKNRIAFFSGTTGLTPNDFSLLKKAGKKIPVLWTANTSIGVQVLKDILKIMPLPKAFSVQLTEWHHTKKKDKPSGTAIVLQKTMDAKRKNLPAPISIRQGNIVGIHKIELSTPEEKLTIIHKAAKRAVFARGALSGAKWLVQKNAGLYTMEDYVSSL